MKEQESSVDFLKATDTKSTVRKLHSPKRGRPRKKVAPEKVAKTHGFSLYAEDFGAIRKLRHRLEGLDDCDVSKAMALRVMIRHFTVNPPNDKALREIRRQLLSGDLRRAE